MRSMIAPISIAVVGLGFGAEFAAIYNRHPDVRRTVIVDANRERLTRVGERFDISDRAETLESVITDPDIDAVHIVSGIPDHAQQTINVLRAGKHCACAVPMATSIEDLQEIIATVKETGLNYMMMETTFYDRTFLWVKDQLDAGVFGEIQMLRGSHYQDMENWPSYWAGLPPMWYATHAVSPILALANTRATHTHCFGSGTMREELVQKYDNPFPIETAIFQLADSSVAAEVTRALFHSAKPYVESFDLHGSKATFEWQQEWGDPPLLHQLSPLNQSKGPRKTKTKRVELPDYAERLPPEIARFTQRGVYDKNHQHLSFEHGGGHGGSHPHLCHEFIRSVVEGRSSAINEIRGADWTAPGICAHQSALSGGKRITIPEFN